MVSTYNVVKRSDIKHPYTLKVIYICTSVADIHKNVIKIGQTTLPADRSYHIDCVSKNSKKLRDAVKKRLRDSRTMGIPMEIKHAELAVIVNTDSGKIESFTDKDVHKVLINSGIQRAQMSDTRATEWFAIPLDTAIDAIKAVKNRQQHLPNHHASTHQATEEQIKLRDEQQDAINKTIKVFKKGGSRMLWNAKMRFGKTLSTLELIKKMDFKKTIILTHRPDVNSSWRDDFNKIFKHTPYKYITKDERSFLEALNITDDSFIYFASIQDLRGSEIINTANSSKKTYAKNETVFAINWDLVVVDEAHEGTTTDLGDKVIQTLFKDSTKLLELSGTPFNIAHKYSEHNTYTWDYIMEQKAREEWDLYHPEEPNPYNSLPKMSILTYDLGEIKFSNKYIHVIDKEFDFREFFRTENGPTPEDITFVHQADVCAFLDLITQTDEESNFPYSTNFRALCRHSLWILPGVKEARALSRLLKRHATFYNFDIINVAGEGDKLENKTHATGALQKVLHAIKEVDDHYYNNNNDYYEGTITLSCGRLTTGVTIPEWTAVFMLSGGANTSLTSYLQTIFRVQSPHTNHQGATKQNCYVFDFSPQRVLKTVVNIATLSKSQNEDPIKDREEERTLVDKVNKHFPIIAVQGAQMTRQSTNAIFQQLKAVYADIVVSNGFDDSRLYNQNALMRIDGINIRKFEQLRGIVGASKSSKPLREITINDQGLQHQAPSRSSKSPVDEEKKEAQAQAKSLISILRAISIRLPLLVYGCDIKFNTETDLEKFVFAIDDISWEEFLPKGVSKELFIDFLQYYDRDVFIRSCMKIQACAEFADTLPPLQRIQTITSLFTQFKNPDKETVLTPWRVVNLHMSECLGGYNFFDTDQSTEIDTPRFIHQGQVTADTFANPKAKILEINSKSGLYPLYAAYSIFKSRCAVIEEHLKDIDPETQNKLWNTTIEENIFVVCRTKMAQKITRRTLIGFKSIHTNVCCFEGLSDTLKNNPEAFTEAIFTPDFWKNSDS